ncbi:MAG: hypothetical protein ACRDPF_23825, partial [Streptosporangiaceae bacterium]
VERDAVRAAMNRVAAWNQMLTSRALDGLGGIDGITIYGPRDPGRRTSLVAFNLAGRDPVGVDRAVEAVAGIAAGRGTSGRRVSGSRFRSWPAGRHRTRQHSTRQHSTRQPSPSAAERPPPVPAASP